VSDVLPHGYEITCRIWRPHRVEILHSTNAEYWMAREKVWTVGLLPKQR
jgi:hypothetical protein